MNQVAVMRCCATAPLLEQYEAATDSLLSSLGFGIVELDLGCCGYPLRNSRFEGWVRSSARNLALAERAKLDLVTVCSCCFGSLKQVDHLLRTDDALRAETNRAMEGERLTCSGTARVRHLLEVLRDDVGLARLEERRTRSLAGLRIACHYGCHLLRPSAVLKLDDATSPSLLDDVVRATGAQSVPWGAQLDCCGSPVAGVNDELARHLAERKLASARDAGADAMCVVCPYCWLQLDVVRRTLAGRGEPALPVVLVHQLVGASLGIAPEAMGMAPDALPLPAARQGGNGARHG
jgi:heterodisulfide reductase subunit B